jgi:hypothetical protein
VEGPANTCMLVYFSRSLNYFISNPADIISHAIEDIMSEEVDDKEANQ